MRQMVQHPHVQVQDGITYVSGSRVAVRRLWQWHKKGVSVATIIKRYPTLGWAKVLCALSWCYDNEEQIERELDLERQLLERDSLDMQQLQFPHHRFK